MLRPIKKAAPLFAGCVVVSTAIVSVYTVPSGHRGIMFNRLQGVESEVRSEGTYFRNPFIQVPIVIDITSQSSNIRSKLVTKDSKMVKANIKVICRVDEDGVINLYRTIGPPEKLRSVLLPSVVQQAMKAVLANYDACDATASHSYDSIAKSAKEEIESNMKNFGGIVEEVAVESIELVVQPATTEEPNQR